MSSRQTSGRDLARQLQRLAAVDVRRRRAGRRFSGAWPASLRRPRCRRRSGLSVPPHRPAAATEWPGFSTGGDLPGSRQQHLELAAQAEAFAVRGHGPAVQLHDAAHQRQADPQPPLRAVGRSLGLREQLEPRGSTSSGDMPMPLSRTDQRDLTPPAPRPAARCCRPPACTWPRCSAGWPAPAPAACGRPRPAMAPAPEEPPGDGRAP